ncbi:thioesterase domain-containing protein, partial [Streptomyces sp. NPDC057638]|uniref:thioesterase domain-containing protein n=1 Tax=Streptomyces sp. NPDC057638 TaxID=3346190 RepID=UPI0036CF9473
TLPPLLRRLAGPARRAVAATAAATGLDDPDPGRRLGALVALVRREAGSVLGVDTPGGLPEGAGFRAAGFDSLTAVELRNRLARATGLRLPVTLVFTYDGPRLAAEFLLARLAERPVTEEPAGPGTGLADIYRELVDRDLFEAAGTLARSAAAVRERADGGLTTTVTRLAEGPGGPRLICLPSISTWEPVLNFSALARHFQGERDVDVIVPPGYETDEPLAASWEALVDVLADATVDRAGDTPYLLVGYSSGGALAHSVAAALQADGRHGPRGVVLIDTYTADQLPARLQESFQRTYRSVVRAENYSYEKITASAAYIALHHEQWRPVAELRAPTLMLSAREATRLPDGVAALDGGEWRHRWPLAHTEVPVPGDHFTMMSQHADHIAQALTGWPG